MEYSPGKSLAKWFKKRNRRQRAALVISKLRHDIGREPTDSEVALLAVSWCRPRRSRVTGPSWRSRVRATRRTDGMEAR